MFGVDAGILFSELCMRRDRKIRYTSVIHRFVSFHLVLFWSCDSVSTIRTILCLIHYTFNAIFKKSFSIINWHNHTDQIVFYCAHYNYKYGLNCYICICQYWSASCSNNWYWTCLKIKIKPVKFWNMWQIDYRFHN